MTMTDYKIEMGIRLKEKRKALHLTQEQMAEKLNVSIKHYGGVERGVAGLSIENLIEASNILGIDLDYLIKGNPPNDDILPNKVREIYLNCPKEKRHHIIEILEASEKLWIN